MGSFGLMEVGINAGAVEAGLPLGACARSKEGKATAGGKGGGGNGLTSRDRVWSGNGLGLGSQFGVRGHSLGSDDHF